MIAGKVVSGGGSEDVVRSGRLVSDEDSEEVVVSLAVEDSFFVSALSDVFDGTAVEVADGEDLLSAEVSDEAGNLGACASTDVKKRIAINNKSLVGKNSVLFDPRIAGQAREQVFDLQGGGLL